MSSLSAERRREDREQARRMHNKEFASAQQNHEEFATQELRANLFGSDDRIEGIHSGYVTALNAMMEDASRMRTISNQVFNESVKARRRSQKQRKSRRPAKPSFKKKHMRDAVGKRTAAQPPPNCKPGRHRRFRDDDDNDPDYKQPRERKRSRFVSAGVRVIKTVNFVSFV